jgi:hypothetical protein
VKAFTNENNEHNFEAGTMRSLRYLDKHIMTTLEVAKTTEKAARRKSIIIPQLSI